MMGMCSGKGTGAAYTRRVAGVKRVRDNNREMKAVSPML